MTRGPLGCSMLAQLLPQAIHLEQVSEPRAAWQVITSLRGARGTRGISEVAVGPTRRAVGAMGMLVVLHRGMLGVVKGDAVVGAEIDRLDSLFVDCLEHFSSRAPRATVGVGGEQGGNQGVYCLRACVGDLVGAHPFEVHEQELTQNDIGRGLQVFGVHSVGPSRHRLRDGVRDVLSILVFGRLGFACVHHFIQPLKHTKDFVLCVVCVYIDTSKYPYLVLHKNKSKQ
jgi:hypothetical protein